MGLIRNIQAIPSQVIKYAIDYEEGLQQISTEDLKKTIKVQQIVLRGLQKSGRLDLVDRINDLAKKVLENEKELAYRERAQKIGYIKKYAIKAIQYVSPQLGAIGNYTSIAAQVGNTLSASTWQDTINKTKGVAAEVIGGIILGAALASVPSIIKDLSK